MSKKFSFIEEEATRLGGLPPILIYTWFEKFCTHSLWFSICCACNLMATRFSIYSSHFPLNGVKRTRHLQLQNTPLLKSCMVHPKILWNLWCNFRNSRWRCRIHFWGVTLGIWIILFLTSWLGNVSFNELNWYK